MKRHSSIPLVLLLISPLSFAGVEVEGRVMLDHSIFDGVHNEHERGSEWQIRRARIGIEHEEGNWEAELEVDFDEGDESIDVKDATLAYTGWSFAEVSFGKMKEPFGLENKTSSLDISTMERSVVTNAFSPGRSIGIEATQGTDRYSWSIGLFQSSEDEHGLEGYAMTGRFGVSPLNREGAVLHLGVSGSARNMQGEGYRVNERMEVNSASKVVETPEILADTLESVSLEGALVYRQFSLQSEWMAQRVAPLASAEQVNGDVKFNGYYVLASYFLTGESRLYDEGSFDRPKPSRSVGAWELVARYSDIDLTDLEQGSSARSTMLGVNWYATDRVRVMLNLSRVDVDGSDDDESGSGNSMSFRLQYEF